MEITNLKTLIENKLACLDIENKTNENRLDSRNDRSILKYELNGIKQALYVMGINLEVSTNPYYFENNQPSTYTLTLKQ